MSIEERRAALGKLETKDNVRLFSLFLADRPGLPTKLAGDVISIVHEHLAAIGRVDRWGVVLYTRGGDPLVPLRLVNLIREYCEEFVAYVPFRCHSAGTMICLGADLVYMSPLGELSPIDPTVQSPLIPKIDGSSVPVGIEDVISYLELADGGSGLTDQDVKAQVFLKLADSLGPIALGNINRTYLGIRALANELLSIRKGETISESDRADLIDSFTTKLYFHDRPICRKEARKIGMNFVAESDNERDDLLLTLLDLYSSDLQIQRPFNPSECIQGDGPEEVEIDRAYIESQSVAHSFNNRGNITRLPQPPKNVPPGVDIPDFAVRWTCQEWIKLDDGSDG